MDDQVSKHTPSVPAVPVPSPKRAARPIRQWPAFVAVTRAAFLSQVRNVATFFFGFLFPLVFISVFGLLGNGGTSVKLGVTDGSDQRSPVYLALSHISAVQISHGSAADLEARLRRGQVDGVLTIVAVARASTPAVYPGATAPATAAPSGTAGSSVGKTGTPGATTTGTPLAGATPTTSTGASAPPPGFPGGPAMGYDVTLATSSASPQNAAAARTFVQGVIDQVNLRAAGVTAPAVTLATKDVAGRQFSFIDFALPGQLGFSLLSIAVFGTAFGFVVLKRTLVLKRIFATPTRPATIVLGQAAARLIIAVAQVAVILAAGVWFFHFHLANGAVTLAEMMVLSIFGLVAFLGFGLVIAGNFNDENAMGPVINLVTLPQFLLSGTFFSTDAFPTWLQPIANNLPLSYLNVALRKVASEGATLYDVRWQLLGILAWGVVTYAVAVGTFKWE
jgi:ABC-2 type transport system permease protein